MEHFIKILDCKVDCSRCDSPVECLINIRYIISIGRAATRNDDNIITYRIQNPKTKEPTYCLIFEVVSANSNTPTCLYEFFETEEELNERFKHLEDILLL